MTIGILPAAGKATRIHGLPKYLLPVPGGYLLERMTTRMGVRCHIGANADNYDLLNAYKRPEDHVYQVNSRGMPETILAARQYAGDENVLVGMPDTYWTEKTDENVFWRLTDYLNRGAFCSASVFRVSAEIASRLGVCIQGVDGYLESIEDKQPQTEAQWVWGALGWRVDFWQYIQPEDTHLGIALQRAVDGGVKIPLYPAFGNYYDNGTQEDYFRCIRELTEVVHAP
jgi:UTP-glucose-1-phosphate uridylyltransferase